MMAWLAQHLWQSTLFLIAAAVMALGAIEALRAARRKVADDSPVVSAISGGLLPGCMGGGVGRGEKRKRTRKSSPVFGGVRLGHRGVDGDHLCFDVVVAGMG